MTEALPASIPVPEHVRDLLLRLVDGWTPAALNPTTVERFRLNDVDFTDMAPHVGFVGERLVAILKGAHLHPRLRELLPFPMNATIDGKLLGVRCSGRRDTAHQSGSGSDNRD